MQFSRLVTEHAWRVDNGRADTVHELYVDDGELTLPPGPVRGRDALRAWGRAIVDKTPWQTIRHVCGNMRFVYDGDNAGHRHVSADGIHGRGKGSRNDTAI